MAQQSHITADAATAGSTPFIASLPLHGDGVQNLRSLRFTIAPAPGTVSKPVSVSQSMAWLSRRGYVPGGNALALPVFGLYAGATNDVSVTLTFLDDSTLAMPVSIPTLPYADPNQVYDQPVVVQQRAAGTTLGYDFYYLKSGLGSPVILDTDGRMRWVATGVPGTMSSVFTAGGFVVGDGGSTQIRRVELDGLVSTPASLGAPNATNFSHNIETTSKSGLLGEVDASIGGAALLRSVGEEFDPTTGAVTHEWNFATVLSNYMASQGDDPTQFVRTDVDWWHMNTLLYDARDDSVIASSRENFVMKIDYATGAVKWIFGDPTKYWYTFPSLRAKALALTPGGFYPLGQHGVNIAPDGNLLLFNNGTPSFNEPAGQPAGDARGYSAVSSYAIDEASRTITETWRFDYKRTLYSRLCSSARQLPDGSLLVNYAMAAQGTQTHLVGLNPAHKVVFDYQFVNNKGCQTSWNAQPIALDNLGLD
jgi:hypothetical protein